MKRKYYIVIIFFLLYCEEKTSYIKLNKYSDATKLNILKVIPKGSEIDFAKKIMIYNGFDCSYKYNDSFMETDGPRRKLHENIDYLYCDLTKGFIVGRRWQVGFIYKDKKVYDVFVSSGLIGP